MNEMISLTAQDRCDGCSARAYVVAKKQDQELMFCKHHKTKAFDALIEQGWEVIEDLDAFAVVEPTPAPV